MFTKFIEIVKKYMSSYNIHSNLDAYITAGKPQSAGDVDRLEREYFRKMQRANSLHFHE